MNGAKVGLESMGTFYDRDNMGRDSPGALLDMLAEVASQTLHSEKKLNELVDAKKEKQREGKRAGKTNQSVFNISQLLSMPATQLVKCFSIFSSDELKKQYSYTCALVPGCGQSYTSFASEGRARMSIKSHLASHLEFLKNNSDAYSSFTAAAVSSTKPKSTVQIKKVKTPPVKKQSKEVVNKENKNTKCGKSNSYLRKILLSNEINVKECENNSEQIKAIDLKDIYMSELKRCEQSDSKLLGDHSYYEHKKDFNSKAESTSNGTSDYSANSKNDSIMLMVLENDGVTSEEFSNFNENKGLQISLNEENTDSMSIWKDDTSNNSADGYIQPKPKGKAKFIGTSKEEREMALLLIEKIRKKGNPTGNNLQCRICDPPRSFTAPTTLVSHYRSHAGIKPYECRICHAVFTRRHSLKYHMLIHQNQTRFTCADCGKKFRHPSHFREHRRRHTGEAPFGCDDCGQRFKTRNTYKRHLKTRHGKVLTISGELLDLSEEDSKKVRTKNRKKKDQVTTTEQQIGILEEGSISESVIDYPKTQENYTWEEGEIHCNSQEEQYNIDDQEKIDGNNLCMYEMYENAESIVSSVEESYAGGMETTETLNCTKTEFNETEIENNFLNNEQVVIAQTNPDGTLHFRNYNYAQEDDIPFNNQYEEPTFDVDGHLDEIQDMNMENMEEITDEPAVESPQECTEDIKENGSELINSNGNESLILIKEDFNGVDKNQQNELINSNVNENLILIKEEFNEANKDQQSDIKPEAPIENNFANDNDTTNHQTVKIIPCQLKVCDSQGKTLKLMKNTKITLKNAQSINLVQNGKQHTFLILNNVTGPLLKNSKSLSPSQVLALPAE